MTGLSIAGGMFLLGWEGAIFGPILLCLVVVIFNLMTNALKDAPSTPNPRYVSHVLDDLQQKKPPNAFLIFEYRISFPHRNPNNEFRTA